MDVAQDGVLSQLELMSSRLPHIEQRETAKEAQSTEVTHARYGAKHLDSDVPAGLPTKLGNNRHLVVVWTTIEEFNKESAKVLRDKLGRSTLRWSKTFLIQQGNLLAIV
eukprot:2548705-Amphidinium_carterae.1